MIVTRDHDICVEIVQRAQDILHDSNVAVKA
jgi:hypothetical protein